MASDLRVRISAEDGASAVFEKVGNSAQSMASAIDKAGESGSGLSRIADEVRRLDNEFQTVGRSMLGFGAALTGLIAAPMALGTKAAWDQVRAVQNATTALRAYEQDASKVERVLQDLVAYARSDMGVLFQRQDLFAAAQGLKVMGAETENLTRYVEIMSRSVGVGAGTWDELGRVIGRVGSTGQLTGVDFDMLTKMGYQLDESMRNAKVTWDEMFDALDRGIPVNALEGAAQNIDGMLIRLQSGIRELGLAILQVDRDTSQFIEGGLGDTLSQGIGQAREVMLAMVPAAQAVGGALAELGGYASAFTNVMLALPQPVQTALAGTTLLTGGLLVMGGTLLLTIPRIVAFGQALAAIRASQTAMGLMSLTGRIGAVGIAIAGIGTAAVLMTRSIREAQAASESLAAALHATGDVAQNLRLSGLEEQARLVDEFAQQVEFVQGTAAAFWNSRAMEAQAQAIAADTGRDYADVLNELRAGYRFTKDEAEAFAAAHERINSLFADSRVDHEALAADLAELHSQYALNQITLDEYAEGVIAIAENYGDYAEAANEATLATVNLGEAFTETGASVLTAAQQAAQARAEFQAFIDDLANMALSLTNNADYLSQLDFMGVGTDATAAAKSMSDLGAALDSVLGIFSQIDAMGSKYGQAVSIAEALIGEPGVWGEIDNMLQRWLENAKTVDEVEAAYARYSATVEAGHAIQLRQAEVENNLNEIRVNQIPILEQTSSVYADYIAQLTELSAAEQMVALGWMDTGMQQRVQDFAELGAGMRRLGADGEAAMQQVIDGIVATDPVLTQMLVNLGLIEEQANGTYTMNFDTAQAMSEIEALNTTLGHLIDTLRGDELGTYEISIRADVSEAETIVRNWAESGYMGGWDAPPWMVPVDADTAPAMATTRDLGQNIPPVQVAVELDFAGMGASAGGNVLDAARQALGLVDDALTVTVSQTGAEETTAALDTVRASAEAIPEVEIINVLVMGADSSAALLDAVTAAANAIPELEIVTVTAPGAASSASLLDSVTAAANAIPESETVVVSVIGAAGAVAALNAVSAAAAAIPPSVTTTITTNRVTNFVTNGTYPGTGIPTLGGRHGGVFGYQHGGVIVEMGEHQPELLHMVGGGVVPVYDRGLYEVPRGSYVSPTMPSGPGNTTVQVHVHGNVYGMDDLTQQVTREMAPALSEAFQRNYREQGVTW